MRFVFPICVALLAATVGCSPGDPPFDPTVTQRYLVYDVDPQTGAYEVVESTIETLGDPRTIDGEIAYLRGGGSLVLSTQEPQTREDWEEAMTVRGDKEPSARYHLEDDLIVPFDYDTQMMVTLYHHLERANDYFESIGFDTDRVGKMPVYYFPQTSLFGINLPLLTDNAAYAYTLDAFIIPPTLLLNEDVPLSANRGVIVHEYSHAVFNRIVHDDSRVPDFVFEGYSPATTNQIRSLDEGVADVFAALAVSDADFIGPSISNELFDIDRDLRIERVWDSELQREIESSDTPAGRNPYLLGSVVASTMWSARDFLSDEELTSTMLAALAEVEAGPSFELVQFFNAFLDNVPNESRQQSCELFLERLERVSGQLDC